MSQSKRASFFESIAGVAVGYGIAVAGQIFIFPLYGVHISAAQNIQIAGVFTVISIARSYFLRRLFNWIGLRPKDKARL